MGLELPTLVVIGADCTDSCIPITIRSRPRRSPLAMWCSAGTVQWRHIILVECKGTRLVLLVEAMFMNIILKFIDKKNIYFNIYKCGHRNVLSKRQVWMSIFHIINLKKIHGHRGSGFFFNKKLILDYYFCLKSGPVILFQIFIIAPQGI
jgi:hypothetical protein